MIFVCSAGDGALPVATIPG